MANPVSFYYHKAAWEFAFSGTTADILIGADGSVYKGGYGFGNLVVSAAGVVGPAGANSEGELTIWTNPKTAYVGAVHALLSTGKDIVNINGGTAVTDAFYHFALVLDNTNSVVKLFINAQQVATVAIPNPVKAYNIIRNCILGRYFDLTVGQEQLQGKIDDFRIYRSDLSDQDIEDVYDWGEQRLQFQNKIYVPNKQTTRGNNASIKLESDDHVHYRGILIQHQNINLR